MYRLLLTLIVLAGNASAQASSIDFSGFEQNSDEPIEVVSNRVDVDDESGTAIFAGGVVATQGEMVLTAEQVEVFYNTGEDRRIRELRATGSVTMDTGSETAEAEQATYDATGGTIIMTGDVLVRQAESAIAGQSMTVDLKTKTGWVEGRVRTIIQTDDE